MKKRKYGVILLVLAMMLLSSCSTNQPMPTETSTTEQTTTVEATTAAVVKDSLDNFKENLEDYFMTRDETVYHFAAEEQKADLLCASREETDQGVVFIFEGEYRDAADRLQFIDRNFCLTKNKLTASYGEQIESEKLNLGTIWLKSPVKAGDSWQTDYLDEKEGFLDAVVTVTNIQKDYIEVTLQIDDSSIKGDRAYQIVKRFYRDESVLGDQIRLADGQLASKQSDESYRYGGDADYLNRFTSDTEWLSTLYSVNPLTVQARVAQFRQEVRNSKNGDEVLKAFESGLYDVKLIQYYDSVVYVDMFNYALAHSNNHVALAQVFYQQTFASNILEEYTDDIEALNMDMINDCLYLAVDEGVANIRAIIDDERGPIPHAGDFLGAKCLEKIYLENGYFADAPLYMQEDVGSDFSPYGALQSRLSVRQHYLDLIETDDQAVVEFLKLLKIEEMLYDDLYNKAFNKNYPDGFIYYDEADYTPYFIELLSQTDEQYKRLDDKYKRAAKDYMNGILLSVFGVDEMFLSKYNHYTGLTKDSYIEPVLSDDYYINVTCQINPNFYKALRNYVETNKNSYYTELMTEMLDALADNYMIYNQPLEDMMAKICPEYYYYVSDVPSQMVVRQDLVDYREIKAKQSTDDAGFVTVDSLKALVQEIAPGKKINLKSGSYIVSSSEYYEGEYAYTSGGELWISGVDDLTIRCNDGLAQIFSDQYYSVLKLSQCKNINFSGLRLGHLLDSGCAGYGLDAIECELINVDNCIMFGSGFDASCFESVKDLSITNSVLSDAQSSGASLFSCENVRLQNLIVRDCDDSAIYCDDSKAVLIKDVKTVDNCSSFEVGDRQPIHIYGSEVVISGLDFNEGSQAYLVDEASTVSNE